MHGKARCGSYESLSSDRSRGCVSGVSSIKRSHMMLITTRTNNRFGAQVISITCFPNHMLNNCLFQKRCFQSGPDIYHFENNAFGNNY